MAVNYRPLTASLLTALGDLEGFTAPTWTGPGLPAPASAQAVGEVFTVLGRLLARAQYLVQAQDAFSSPYTLSGITASAERFMLGTEGYVERNTALRALAANVQGYIDKTGLIAELEAHGPRALADIAAIMTKWIPARFMHGGHAAPPSPSSAAAGDYSALALEDMHQFAMGWTTLSDVFRNAYPRLPGFVADLTDPQRAGRQLWTLLKSTALPYNLLVVQRLGAGNVEPFRSTFATFWNAACDTLLAEGKLYGIDMTIFSGLKPRTMANGTTRFTPSTMTLLALTAPGELEPIAVTVADPAAPMNVQTYTPTSPAWIYSLLAVRTSLTVHGIWLGHVFPLHLVSAAAQMAMWNTLPPHHVLHQALAPHSHGTIGFNFLLLIGWNQLAPPTSIADTGEFMTLAARYASSHDFFSTDPHTKLASLGLDKSTFTSPGGADWDLYPNVRRMLQLWNLVADYVHAVVTAGYATDADIANDPDLAAFMAAASAPDCGNLTGFPSIRTKQMLEHVLTSLLYRIIFHGMGKLRDVGNPEPTFVADFPPCLQSTRIPKADEAVTTAVLLREFLPRTGTIGEVVTFYDLFAFTAPSSPLIPIRGADSELYFDDRFPGANQALVAFRKAIEALIADVQPDWVQIGQWPVAIEF